MLSVILSAISKAAIKLTLSVATEEFMIWAFFSVGNKVVKSTENTTDNEWLEKIKESYELSKLK